MFDAVQTGERKAPRLAVLSQEPLA
jgi:hypothetical protein